MNQEHETRGSTGDDRTTRDGGGSRSRRRILQGSATLAAAGLAGCVGGIGIPGGGGGGDGSDPGPNVTELTPADCEPETVSDDVVADTTWSADDCPRVAIDGNVRVDQGATLTIEPGVEVVGLSGSRITVKAGSTLSAVGDPDDPVWFYGESATPGYWQGIRFRSETDNELDNVVLRHGGGNGYANVYLDDQSRVSVTNVLSGASATTGLTAVSGTTLAEFSANRFRDNEEASVAIPTTHAGSIDAASTYGGGEGVVDVFSADVEADATWPATDAPYRFAGQNHRLFGTVTVEAGAHLTFDEGGRVTVKDGGAFAAEGTAEDPVVVEGESATPGYWQGIRFRSNNRNNSLDHLEIAHGGGNGYANVYLDDESRVSVTNTTAEASATAGIVAESGTTLAEFSNNSFADNEVAAISVPTTHAGSIDGASAYGGGVRVFSADVEEDATWPATDAPYRFAGQNHRLFGTVTVEAGAHLTFDEGGRVTVKDGGAFTAEGASDDRIVIEGTSDERGHWQGIRLRSNNRNNSFDNVEVANGGANGYANVYLDDSSRASVTDSTLRASATFGIIAENGTTLEASGNTFENNAEGEVRNENQ